MMKYLLLLFVITKIYEVATLPSHFHKPKEISHVSIHHDTAPTHNYIQQVPRKKKGPNVPYQTYFIQNLHVIPLSQHQVHTENGNNMQHNITQQLIPVLIPFHNYVPVQDLTVIPLHRVRETKSGYGVNEDVGRTSHTLATLVLIAALAGVRCDAPHGYLVDKATGTGYRLVYQAQTWPVARDRCREDGAKLAVPKTAEEFQFMQKLVRGMSYSAISGSEFKLLVWLGIHNLDDYRVWKNIDGENIEETGFHKWSHGNGEGFSDAAEEPHCAGLDAVNLLRDYWCDKRQPYICQIKLT